MYRTKYADRLCLITKEKLTLADKLLGYMMHDFRFLQIYLYDMYS